MPGGRNKEVERERRLELAVYLQEVMQRAGYPTQAQLARDIGVEASRVSHWLKGDVRGLSAYALLQVIRAAERREAGAADPSPPVLSTRLQSLEATVEEQGESTSRAIRGLARDLRSLSRRLDRGEDQASEGGS